MVDCGDNTSTGWEPGKALVRRGITSLERLIVTNYDEDHASGFANDHSENTTPAGEEPIRLS